MAEVAQCHCTFMYAISAIDGHLSPDFGVLISITRWENYEYPLKNNRGTWSENSVMGPSGWFEPHPLAPFSSHNPRSGWNIHIKNSSIGLYCFKSPRRVCSTPSRCPPCCTLYNVILYCYYTCHCCAYYPTQNKRSQKKLLGTGV